MKLFLLTLFFISINLADDVITVKSQLLSNNEVPISNAHVYVNNIGTTSDANGFFILECNKNDILKISHIAFGNISIKASNITDRIIIKPFNLHPNEIVVNSSYSNETFKESNSSISIIRSSDINDGKYQHFEDVINLIPNLNFSGGTSRPKYFQIRGVGELSQFSGEGPPQFYVGYIIDDIDFSGIGAVGILTDVNQIEVFKGPQSVIYGPNTSAGVINIVTNNPTPYSTGSGSMSLNDDNGYNISSKYSNKLFKNLLYNIAISKNYSDGFRKNKFFNISNSNKKDESLFKSKLFYQLSKSISLKLTSYLINIHNGYDVWTPDNNGFNTYSDYKGIDCQKVNAHSIKTTLDLNEFKLISITSYSDNTIDYAYDADWGNDTYWKNEYDWYANSESYQFNNLDYFPYGYYSYTFTDSTHRQRNQFTQELRLYNKNNVFGIYLSNLQEDDNRFGWLFGGKATSLDSKFKIENTAIYFKTKFNLNQKLNIELSIRNESYVITNDFKADYYGESAGKYNKVESSNLLGARVDLDYNINNNLIYTASISKAYKPSGINQSINIGNVDYSLDESIRTYNTENLYNSEIGAKFISNQQSLLINLFYMHRESPQVRLSYQLNPLDPASFDFYTINANYGYSYGIEGQYQTTLSDNIYFYDNFAILKSYIGKYKFLDSVVGNRTQAHAPEFSASAGFVIKLKKQLNLQLNHSITSNFYYEDQYENQSSTYQIMNITFIYTYNKFDFSLWIKNVLNEKYEVRGYSFSLEPSPNQAPYFFENSYQSFGNPRNIGITINYKF